MGMGSQKTALKDDIFYWLALYLTPGVGSVFFTRLLKRFKTPQAVFQASKAELAEVPRLPRKAIAALTRFHWSEAVEQELKAVEEKGIKLLTLSDPIYPPRLKEIHDPPPLLWVDGEIEPRDQIAVAIVGSRGATDYGREISGSLAGELAAAGVCVISGMALGIDSAAHEGALAAGGRTLAVLGCGVDVIYPRPNRELLRRIPGQGALISEFPLGTKPEPGFFPVRNRIISGLSLGVVVVEAGPRSGSLITARLALEQNREVFAVPGRVASQKTRGTHTLLKQGARLVETAQDILEEIAPQLHRRSGLKDGPAQEAVKTMTNEVKPDLAGDQEKIWKALSSEPLHVDKIGRQVNLTPPQLAPLLLELELKGLIRQLPGMMYIRVNE